MHRKPSARRRGAAPVRTLGPRARLGFDWERLEERTLLSTFAVTNTDDDLNPTPGSLRAAILAANADNDPAGATIVFDMDPSDENHVYYQDDQVDGHISLDHLARTTSADDRALTDADPQHPQSWWSITPAAGLPVVTSKVVFDGYSQPGSKANDRTQGDDAVLRIELVGAGLSIGDDCTVRGIVINRVHVAGDVGTGIVIGGKRESVAGNFIGTDVSGTVALANDFGITIDHGTDCLIGGTSPAARNIISGNGVGIYQTPTDSTATIQGNYIGTDPTGTRAVGNRIGINAYVTYIIGGTAEGAGNVVSGNETGLHLIGYSTQNVIQGNYVGTDAAGMTALGNHNGFVMQYGGPGTIGGTVPGAGNVISGNGIGVTGDGSGLHYEGNLVGTNKDGSGPLGNSVGFSISGSNNTVGGTAPGARNVISGNNTGVAVFGTNNVVAGNFIGTDVGGTRSVGNGTGVLLGPYARDNTVGGTTREARNIISGNLGDGIALWRTGGGGDVPTRNVIQGNYIGPDVTGMVALGNNIGVDVIEGTDNTIAGNVIAGAGLAGVYLGTTTGTPTVVSGNKVQGNLIGTDQCGDTALPNRVGVELHAGGGVTGNLVGGTTAAERNVISGNLDFGVVLGVSSDNRVMGNLVGTDATGTQRLGNGGGVSLFGGSYRNAIGGTAAGEANVIANSTTSAGIMLDSIGISGQLPTGDTFRGNSIYDNAGGGIRLGAGTNNGQRAPFLDNNIYLAPAATVTGFSTPNGTIDLYANAAPDLSGFGQGQVYLGSTTADGSGRFSVGGLPIASGQWISATATDAAGNTSAFSRDVKALDLVNLTLGSAPATAYLADSVTFTVGAQVLDPNAGDPIATVTFFDSTDRSGNPTILGTAPLVMAPNSSSGTATLATASLPLGARTVTIGFSTPSGNFAWSLVGPQSVSVTVLPPPPTTTTVAVATSDPVAGLPMTVTASVAAAPGRGAPTGTVTFYDGGATLGTATLTGSGDAATATLTFPAPAGGGHVIRAAYGGTTSSPIYPASDSLSSRVSTVAAPGAQPGGISVDAAGDVFNAQANDVVEFRTDGAVTTIAPGFEFRTANVAVDPSDGLTVYIAGEVAAPDSPSGYQTVVYRWSSGSLHTVFTDDRPASAAQRVPLAVDGTGNVYVAPTEAGTSSGRMLYKIPKSGPVVSFPQANLGRSSLVADHDGNVFVFQSRTVSKLLPDGTLTPVFTVATLGSSGLAVDGADNLFVAGPRVYEGRPDGAFSLLTGGVLGRQDSSNYRGVAVDAAGNLYFADSDQFVRVDLTPNLTVRNIATSDVQSLLAHQGGSATIRPTSNAVVSNVVQAINGLSSPGSGTETVTLDLGGGTFTTDTHVQAPAGVTVIIVNGTLVGGSPALIVDSGAVVLKNVTASNATNAPTIVVNGGSLKVRNSTIQESTGYAQAAIRVNGGTADLGTAADPGGNTINVNGAGELVHNAGPNPVSALGDTFAVDGVPLGAGFALEDRIHDYLDSALAGLVVVDTSGNAYVTAGSGSVQRGVDVAASGGTVYVQGDLKGDFTVRGKPLAVVFQDGTTLALRPDPTSAGATALFVTGTSGDDKLSINAGKNSGDVSVAVNKLPTGTFHPTGRLVVRGGAGDDDIQVAGGITLPAWLYGEDGNDRLKGGAGANVLLGGAGDDLLVGGSNRDLLIGGTGADKIVGNESDDILIAGVTAFDANDAALAAVMAEWTSGRSYADRVRNLRGESAGRASAFTLRANGEVYLAVAGNAAGRAATVNDDGDADTLTGDQGLDWFLFNADGENGSKKDKATDLSAAEFADDLDFINGA